MLYLHYMRGETTKNLIKKDKPEKALCIDAKMLIHVHAVRALCASKYFLLSKLYQRGIP
jgi:hypothetical protein